MRLTLKAKVILLALVPVILFALVLSGTAARVLQSLAAEEVAETRERLLQDIDALMRETAASTGRAALSPCVRQALRSVPRERFVPPHLAREA